MPSQLALQGAPHMLMSAMLGLQAMINCRSCISTAHTSKHCRAGKWQIKLHKLYKIDAQSAQASYCFCRTTLKYMAHFKGACIQALLCQGGEPLDQGHWVLED